MKKIFLLFIILMSGVAFSQTPPPPPSDPFSTDFTPDNDVPIDDYVLPLMFVGVATMLYFNNRKKLLLQNK